jgi:uncharacterized DUF497 family protein
VVDWHRFDPAEWRLEYDTEKLEAHGVAEWEAAEMIWRGFVVRPNKRFHGPNRFQLFGRTDGGRPLKLIVQVFGDRWLRVITGWPL